MVEPAYYRSLTNTYTHLSHLSILPKFWTRREIFSPQLYALPETVIEIEIKKSIFTEYLSIYVHHIFAGNYIQYKIREVSYSQILTREKENSFTFVYQSCGFNAALLT